MRRLLLSVLVAVLVLGFASVAVGRDTILDFWRDDVLAKFGRTTEPIAIDSADFPVFYSPDGQSSVSLTLGNESMTEYINVYPVLAIAGKTPTRLDRVLEYLPSVNGKNPPVIWIGNGTLLLSGSLVYSLDSGSFTPLDSLRDINWLAAYAVSQDGAKLAVHGSFTGGPHEVGVVDLSTKAYERIFTADLPDGLYHMSYQIGWDCDGNLYFDFPDGTRPVVRRYDGKEVTAFLTDAVLSSLSPGGTMLAWWQLGSIMPKVPQPPQRAVVLDLESNKELLEVGAYCESLWTESDGVAGLLDRESGTMYLYSRGDPAYLTTVELPKGSVVTDFIRLTDEGIVAFVVSDQSKSLTRVLVPFR